jgi:F-type H+-transporting ATPase subunit b
MEIISNVALISINETLWVQMLSFLLFLYIMNRVMFRPLRGVMADRQDFIAQLKTDTVAIGRKYEELTKQISSQEASVRRAANKARREKEEAGSREAEKILAEVLAQIDRVRKDAEKEVARQVADARVQLAAETQTLATAIIEKVLERRISQ